MDYGCRHPLPQMCHYFTSIIQLIIDVFRVTNRSRGSDPCATKSGGVPRTSETLTYRTAPCAARSLTLAVGSRLGSKWFGHLDEVVEHVRVEHEFTHM